MGFLIVMKMNTGLIQIFIVYFVVHLLCMFYQFELTLYYQLYVYLFCNFPLLYMSKYVYQMIK